MASSAAHHDELLPEQTEGFKVGEKKTMGEYAELGKSTLLFSWSTRIAILPADVGFLDV